MERDLREWLAKVQEMGQLKTVEGADWDLEIGAVTQLILQEKDIDITRHTWSSPLDLTIRKPTNAFFNSRAIIDACRPYDWIDEFPKAIEYSPELFQRVRGRWKELFQEITNE